MRTIVIGLDLCEHPRFCWRQIGLTNLRQLMSRGCYGRIESVIPPITAAGVDVHGHEPGSRLARRVRLSEQHELFVRRTGLW